MVWRAPSRKVPEKKLLCRHCEAELTSTDAAARRCTQCQTAINLPLIKQLDLALKAAARAKLR